MKCEECPLDNNCGIKEEGRFKDDPCKKCKHELLELKSEPCYSCEDDDCRFEPKDGE